MTQSQQRLLSELATSDNELASGLGQCLETLRLISALPRASPVFVKYASTPSSTTKAFALPRPSPRDPSPGGNPRKTGSSVDIIQRKKRFDNGHPR